MPSNNKRNAQPDRTSDLVRNAGFKLQRSNSSNLAHSIIKFVSGCLLISNRHTEEWGGATQHARMHR